MIFLETLKANLGGLLRVKTSLYWYGAGCWDNNPGRVSLILDADRFGAQAAHAAVPSIAAGRIDGAACVFLLIDESPKWVWSMKNTLSSSQVSLPYDISRNFAKVHW